MPIIKNKKEYDLKIPTNIRIENRLKALLLNEAKERKVTLAFVVNEIFANWYKEKGE